MTETTLEPPLTPAGAGSRDSFYLHVGQTACFSNPTSITTILGSCVAVCLWEPTTGVGGMNHYLLPGFPDDDSPIGRYGHAAFRILLERMRSSNSDIARMKAKVFGGASLHGIGHQDLGRGNIDLAFELLETLAVPVIASDVGGRHGRKVVFQTDDGTAWVKKLGVTDGPRNS